MPTTDIFIKTYSGDREYHKYCLQSIDKFCTGFKNVVVREGEHPRGYLFQQVEKLHADVHCDADYILITDSDTLFTMPVTPETYMVDGKPIWLHTPFNDEMLFHAGTRAWFDVMTEFFGEEPNSEKMRRQPFFFPSWLPKKLREFCYEKHGVSIEEYVMSRKSFSEFNVLGHFAWLYHRDEFHWIDTSKDELPKLTVAQMWSHTPISQIMNRIREILK